VAHILEASGILERSLMIGELVIVDRFFRPVDILLPEQESHRFALNSILNLERPAEESVVERRRSDFQAALRALSNKQ
jgi:hypothetical protein